MAFFNHERMVVSVIKAALVAMLIGIVLLWLFGGGIGKIIGTAGSLRIGSVADLLSASNTAAFADFHLPWQIDMPQVSVAPVQDQEGGASQGSASHATFANASRYAGDVHLLERSARAQTAQGQYLELLADNTQGAPIAISGWSLESALSGTRAYIPQAADLFIQGQINAVANVSLTSGGSALIVTGPSPVGVSFRENECTGYLGTLQPFVPPLPQQCPSPLDSIPHTAESEASLGADCFQYLQSLPACTFPASPPSSLSAACRSRIQNALSYNGCLQAHQHDAQFLTASWRLYLAQGMPLWGGTHDVIRLLDEQGRIVDVLNY